MLGISHIGDANLVPLEQPNTLHLVEDRIVRLVHCVLSVDVAQTEEGAIAFLQQRDLVNTCVGSQDSLLVEVVGVSWLAADMIRRNAQCVKAIVGFDDRVKVLKKLEVFPRQSYVRNALWPVEEVVGFGD